MMILDELNAYRTPPDSFTRDENQLLSYGPAETVWSRQTCSDEDSFAPAQTESLSKDIYKITVSLPRADELRQNLGRMVRFNCHFHKSKVAFSFDAIEFESVGTRKEEPEDPQAIWRAALRAFSQLERFDNSSKGEKKTDAKEMRLIWAKVRELLALTATGEKKTDAKEMRLIWAKVRELLALTATSIHTEPPVAEVPSDSVTVLESFDGFVDSIDGDTAYVTLESRMNGEVLYGEYSASELLSKGIRERNRFLCETVTGSDGGRVVLSPLSRIKVTDEEARSIADEMREAFPGDDYDVIEY